MDVVKREHGAMLEVAQRKVEEASHKFKEAHKTLKFNVEEELDKRLADAAAAKKHAEEAAKAVSIATSLSGKADDAKWSARDEAEAAKEKQSKTAHLLSVWEKAVKAQ